MLKISTFKLGLLHSSVLLSSLVLLNACGGSDLTHKQVESKIKSNQVKLAYAMYSDSLDTAQTLQTAVNDLLDAPTEDNLIAARAAYKAARVPYQQSEVMRWDSDITLGTNTADEGISSVDNWEGQVNAWPLDESFIDFIIEETDASEINTTFLIDENGADDNEANVSTGVHAIEFLLWGEDAHKTSSGAGERVEGEFDLASCVGGNCESRRKYLSVAVDLLVTDLTNMQAEWSPEAAVTAGTLANNFLNSKDAISYIVAAMQAMATDELASARMGSAFELLDSEEEHDCFSDLSHVAIYYNFQGVRNAFYGSYKSANYNIDGYGVGDLLKIKDRNTYNTLEASLNSIETKMKQIYDLGELDDIRFDQLVGQKIAAVCEETNNANVDLCPALADPAGEEYLIVEAASAELIALESQFHQMSEALSIELIATDGGSDGD